MNAGSLCNETRFADRLINVHFSSAREILSQVFRGLTGRRGSGWPGLMNRDLVLGARLSGNHHCLRTPGMDLGMLLFLQLLWIISCIRMGRISVTETGVEYVPVRTKSAIGWQLMGAACCPQDSCAA